MPELTLAGAPVYAATLTVPLVGAWVLDVATDAEVDPPAHAELVHEGATRWRGAVVRGRVVDLRWSWRLVGGGGGLATVVPARQWRAVPLGMIVRDLCTEIGETLSARSDETVLGRLVPSWTRRAGRAADALALLVDAGGVPWRVDASGELVVGEPSWLPYEGTAERLAADDPITGTGRFGLDAPTLEPGMLLDGRRVGGVQYTFGADLEAMVWWWP